jgi:hypothetical protein
MILGWLLYVKAKHIVKKGESCDIILGELSKVEYGIKEISLLIQDGT